MRKVRQLLRGAQEGATRFYVRVQNHPTVRRAGAVLRGNLGTAVEREEGQGLIEYIIAIAGAFLVAAAVMALFRAIRSKYGEATNSVNQLQISAP